MSEKIYWIEEPRPGRHHVYYLGEGKLSKVLFDICDTKKDAEKAIEDHKNGNHSTQYAPPVAL
jgi:hypothetical protein